MSDKRLRIEANREAALARKRQRVVMNRLNPLGVLENARDVDLALGACLNEHARTEISGPPSSGKTILAATIAANALRRKSRADVLFIETSGPHPHRLCLKIASSFLSVHSIQHRILSTSALDLEPLIYILSQQVSHHCRTRQVALVILDSVGDILRPIRTHDAAKRRLMTAITQCPAPILFTNHISANFSSALKFAPTTSCNESLIAKIANIRLTLSSQRIYSTSSGEKAKLCRTLFVTALPLHIKALVLNERQMLHQDDELSHSSNNEIPSAQFDISNFGIVSALDPASSSSSSSSSGDSSSVSP
uniref:RecA family profile 1 domain-containing protein n=1 Tax=Aureoumbra lagunensis TaxID=44058 RepID=A0A7S3JX81_9STRA